MIKTPYLIVGNGRLAKHLKHYLTLLKIQHLTWNRNSTETFAENAKSCERILLAISDDAINNFISDNQIDGKQWIHFSGSLNTDLAESTHPLMTFPDELYEDEFYKTIPFVTIKNRMNFQELFPGLPNPNYKIEASKKILYHAWCSMAGNFTSLLWNEFFKTFENNFGIDKSVAYPYLQKISESLITSNNPLTGPLSRGDTTTIQKHLSALEGNDISNVYKAFVDFYNKQLSSKQ